MDSIRVVSESTIEPKGYPGMWQFPKDPDKCCIYRVPERLRSVNAKAYTPQLVIIGPLHHSLKSQALNSLGDITNTKRAIEEEEERIRESYSESTTWIESSEFVEMILLDSVFILEFFLRRVFGRRGMKTGDPLNDEPCLTETINSDLMLLENQLPYFILHNLFHPIFSRLVSNMTFRELITASFGYRNKIGDDSNFSHFTDLARCVRIEKLQGPAQHEFKRLRHLFNAEKLYSGGVKLDVLQEELSLEVRFENGCLKMPRLLIEDNSEMKLRNIMALEQCHYPFTAHVSSYVLFLERLIDTDKDVDLLVDKGIIQIWIGQPSSVAEMVNKLGLGITDIGSYYSDIAVKVNAHYSNPLTKSQIYLENKWLGTAAIVATVLLLLTFIQTVASLIQVVQNA
ncbi:unnamed protein product [Microthlaspi erraticum]|uniref:DUF247 domain-containing protein n=1 Tax=Microthlaspi erraticum TaxID=1685480 RepID=A0A6D2IUM1_9BRAS|nr:unnamed protein product [Microthlaspi erraticum]